MTTISKSASPDEFWDCVETVYGHIPALVKMVLQINGFDSFLALKGIRYDNNQEFFQSLEATVNEILLSDVESEEKAELQMEIAAQHQNALSFRLKPGHRNYIMNLFLEIDKSDVGEFFKRSENEISSKQTSRSIKTSPVSHQYALACIPPPETSGNLIIRRSESEKPIIVSRVEHGYSQDNETETEYVYEDEEYLTDDTMDSIFKTEYETIEVHENYRKRKSTSNSSSGSARRKPAQMYNEEFMAKSVNPRRRRVTLNKTYPPTDEGTRERFTDLLQQSLECILPREKLSDIQGCEIHLEKESDSTWAVQCPLCLSRIRLPVVLENGGRYCNYKRSNFERHLRFKHCKTQNREEIYDAVEGIEEIVV